ncbi:MAG TPA: hypothetical protein VFA45_13250 [Actinomycetes bacterium]|jgi:hypothetical protein|nr:hypothetical protein [Actinomycetes bacterium]
MTERRSYRNDLPGSSKAPCLGCGRSVVTARDAHVEIVGKRDGSVLMMYEAEPLLAMATNSERVFETSGLELLGVAHRACVQLARQRLEAQQVELPDDLPRIIVDQKVKELPALDLPPASDHCAFCHSPEVTDEHVWPKWISRMFRDQGSGLFMPSPYGRRRLRSIDITAPVCKTCNHRWLSVLENDVQPVLSRLIRGQEGTLDPDQQRLLATWAVKTALMLDLGGRRPFIPTGFYREFRLRRCPLSSQVVWLGAYRGSRYAAWASHRALHVGISSDEPPNGFVSTFTAFRAVFQVAGHFTRGNMHVEDRRLMIAALARIWPPRAESIDWPPQKLAFGDDSLAELAQSIEG